MKWKELCDSVSILKQCEWVWNFSHKIVTENKQYVPDTIASHANFSTTLEKSKEESNFSSKENYYWLSICKYP